MRRARVKDWLIGAGAMLLLLLVLTGFLWWQVSVPENRDGATTPSPPAAGDSDTQPPSDLTGEEVWFADLALDAGTLVTAGSRLRDVRARAGDVVTGPDGLVAGRVTVDATVPFQVVADELGEGVLVGPAEDGQAKVVRTVAALGREVRVVATGTVEVVAGRLVVEPRSIGIGGPDFLSDFLGAAVRQLVTIEHDIEGLPPGLVLQDVAVRNDGFRARLSGADVRLVAAGR